VTEDRVNGGSERLAAVQDDEDTLVAVKAAVDEIGEQLDADAIVLRRAVPQAGAPDSVPTKDEIEASAPRISCSNDAV
jgi:hypothetical protein